MDIRVRGRAGAGEAVSQHARARVFYALLHRSSHVERVDVQVGENGAAGEAGGFCLVRVRLGGIPPATIVQIGTDLYAAVDDAAERARRLVSGQILAANRAIASPPPRP